MGARTAEPTGAAELNEPVPTAEKLGRYSLCFELASGGMASVYLARAEGPAGFEKLVALKRIHPHLRAKTDFVEMFLDEARIASRVNHPNVCSVFDFGEADGTYFIAMEYILGETFGRFARALARAELDDVRRVGVIARILADACEGLHAAHELRGDDGRTLGVVHRDISPQNLFVAYDGTVRVVDFGIARAEGRIHIGETLDHIVLRALSRDRDDRFATAREMGRELNRYIARAGDPVTPADVADWMEEHFAEEKARREELVEQSRHTPAGAVPRVSARLGGELPSDPLEQVPTVQDSDVLAAERSSTVRKKLVRTAIALLMGATFGIALAVATGDGEAPPAATEPVAEEHVETELVRTVTAPPGRPAVEESPPPIELDEPAVAPVPADVEAPTEVAEEPTEREESTEDDRPARASRRTRLRPGTLSIATPGGWAEVFVGARRVGRAPGEVHLPAGNHLVRLRPCGRGAERRRRVHLPSGGEARLVVQIDPEDCRP